MQHYGYRRDCLKMHAATPVSKQCPLSVGQTAFRSTLECGYLDELLIFKAKVP